MGKRLIRTDKNGTQYWVDDRCPKCGGTGFIQCYYDGGICYQCGGSGYWKTSWKVYTPEYQAKLDERRRLKAEQDKAKFEENIAEYRKELGLAENGLCYIVMAKTFGKTDELKAAGGRYNGSWWYLDHPDAAWDTEEYDPKGLLVKDYKKRNSSGTGTRMKNAPLSLSRMTSGQPAARPGTSQPLRSSMGLWGTRSIWRSPLSTHFPLTPQTGWAMK